MDKVLTVAVPAYNAERCLDKCLISMLAPEALERLEVIVVDDGSADSTGAIADRWASRYPGSVSVIHKENGGHGSAVNAAVKAARGRYFRVVDADDWLITENLSVYLDELKRCEADVVINSFYRVAVKSGRRIPVAVPPSLRGQAMSVEKAVSVLGAVRNCFTIHGMTYLLKSYRASGAVLSEQVFYEDNEFTTLPFSHVRSIFFSPLFLYCYLIGNQDQSISDQNQVAKLPNLQQVLFRLCGCLQDGSGFSTAVRGYALEKAAAVTTSCLITSLLREPDRLEGRQRAQRLMGRLQKECPAVYERSLRQYRRLQSLHRLHVSGRVLDYTLDCAVYRMMREWLRKP